ncbi:MAG: ATP-binding cassette domain-containing protein [Candidatus Aegiribacteria sp.]|nr:ATP-binding cassette domain-containing protein [Candidatus Aegiribacteria sp.]MBD3294662.1 ATP-binding cassette domain-containing protein [Candidatus Fermentibacteria bacterium]
MSLSVLSFNSVTYRYPGSPETVLEDISFSVGAGWTAIAGANGSGKTTLLKLATGMIKPDSGTVHVPEAALYCRQRTDHPPEGFEEFVRRWQFPGLMSIMGLEWDWPHRWNTLSYSERKRAQLAMALSVEPAVLAVDEPVNHLDDEARQSVAKALLNYSGIGLLVTHDRDLMENIACRCGIIHPEGIRLRSGGYEVARREDRREQEAIRSERERARATYLQLKRDARRKQLQARTLQARSSGRNISYREICRTGADGPSRIDGCVQKAGQLTRTAKARMSRARENMESHRYRKKFRKGISMESSRCSRNTLLSMEGGKTTLRGITLLHPELVIKPQDRIALTGSNGSGKSSLVEMLVEGAHLPRGRLLYIPQELSAERAAETLREAREMGSSRLGSVMTCMRRLGSDPGSLLDGGRPSPGESRKLLLCLGLLKCPWLVVMDEPTNHLDITGIECLEEALESLECSLLLVSHDRTFLKRTTNVRWNIRRSGDVSTLEVI